VELGLEDAPEDEPRAGRVHVCVNTVHLIGRLGSSVQERTLPSGDVVVTFHVVVDRPAGIRGTGRPRRTGVPGVDAIACAAWSGRARRTVGATAVGTWIEVEGSLRRRFRRGGTTPTSFYEVEVVRVRRLG
jgi:single-strand DNA-binding protein